MRIVSRRLGAVLVVAALAAGCAARTVPAPPLPDSPKYPEFVFPAAPAAGEVVGTRQDRGWRFLQSGDLRNAEREFDEALRTRPRLAPAQTGLAYVALAQQRESEALERFDRALEWDAAYAPALAGRGQALLAMDRHEEALKAFEAALDANPALDLAPRVAVLRLRSVQDRVARARQAAERGDWIEARDSYRAALEASPDSGFLYRELAVVERRANELAAAEEHYRKALELDAGDVRAQTGLAEVLEARGDLKAALDQYSAAAAIEPSADLDRRMQSIRERLAEAALPAEYRRIGESPAATRGDLAAALGVELRDLLPETPHQGVLVTDVRDHWAASWIVRVVRAGVMEPYPNHTFQPGNGISRGDLAQVVSRMLDLISAQRPEAASTWGGARPRITDVPPTHLAHAAVAQTVAAGVLNLDADGAFHLTRRVSGPELMTAIDRLRALAGPRSASRPQ